MSELGGFCMKRRVIDIYVKILLFTPSVWLVYDGVFSTEFLKFIYSTVSDIKD